MSRVAELDLVALQEVLRTNVVGCFLCARAAIRRMSRSRGGAGGAIVNLSSRAAAIGGAGEWVACAASKGAIDTFTVGLARELGPEGIRVNAVRPGLIATEIQDVAGASGRLQRLLPSVALGRVGTAEEVAETILWRASDQAAYVTGALLDVGGGR